MNLPYNKIIQEVNDESGHYFYGRIMELDGCQSTGDTIDELYENLTEAMEGYLPIPEPVMLMILAGDLLCDYQNHCIRDYLWKQKSRKFL